MRSSGVPGVRRGSCGVGRRGVGGVGGVGGAGVADGAGREFAVQAARYSCEVEELRVCTSTAQAQLDTLEQG